jgi:hypothetical protein
MGVLEVVTLPDEGGAPLIPYLELGSTITSIHPAAEKGYLLGNRASGVRDSRKLNT